MIRRRPVPFWPRDPGTGMGKKSGSGTGIREKQPASYFLELRNHIFGLKYLNSLKRVRDPESKIEKVRIRDPGWKKVGSGIRDRKKHPGSATLDVILMRRLRSIETSLCIFRRCVHMYLLRCIRIPRPQQRRPIDTSLCIFRRCVSPYPNPSSDLLIHLLAFSGAVYVSPSLYPNPSSPATTTYYDTSTYTGLTTSPQSQLVSYAGAL